jgi:Transposase DDE domain
MPRSRAAAPYDRRSSVTNRSGAKAYFFRSLRISFRAACLLRSDWKRQDEAAPGRCRAQIAGSLDPDVPGCNRKARGCEEVTVLADRGYYDGDEVLACEGTGILPVIPKTQTSSNPKRGLFTVADFIYDAENDRYTCPAGEHLTKGKVRSDRRDNIDHYRNLTACLTCALKPRCMPDKVKRLKRWEHESVLDKMQARLDHMPEAMTIRRQTVEHPFGTLKAWMGSTHFLTRTLEKVKTEMSLQVLAFNMKRMINLLGVKPLMQAIAT